MPHTDELFHQILIEHLGKIWREVEVLDGALCVDACFIAFVDGQELDFGAGVANDHWANLILKAGDPLFFDKLTKYVEEIQLSRKPQ